MKSLKVILVVFLNLSVITVCAEVKRVLKITSEHELKELAQIVNSGELINAEVSLENDIYLTESWMPIGNASNPFRGRFNGNNHKIENLRIGDTHQPDLAFSSAGFFGYVGPESEIINTQITNAQIFSNRKGASIGALAGHMKGRVVNCKINEVTIEGSNSHLGAMIGVLEGGAVVGSSTSGELKGAHGSLIGGIAGYVEEGSLRDTYSSVCLQGNIASRLGGLVGLLKGGEIKNSSSHSNMNGGKLSNIGGVAGETSGGKIDKCAVAGRVSGESNTCSGGLIGLNNECLVTDCFVNATLKGKGRTGMIVGSNQNGEFVNCYFNQEKGQSPGEKVGKLVYMTNETNLEDVIGK